MARFRVVIVRELSQEWDEPDADELVRAATAHAAAREVLHSLGGGAARFIEVRALASQSSCVRYLYCNLHAGEFTYGLCCVPRNA
jgi:hypothetical protein